MSVYDFKAKTIRGEEISLETYKGKVLLIVNTASKCGLTPQYEGLQALYERYKDEGLVILGFLPLFAKVDVIGDNAHPLFKYLTSRGPAEQFDIKWNFAKFLVDREGNVVERIDPQVTPAEIEGKIKSLLA